MMVIIFFFIDEVGFNVSMRIKRGRSLSGTRAIQTVTKIRSRNISVCCSMSKNGKFHYQIQNCPFNTESFLEFIKNLLEKFQMNNISNAVLIMDNVTFHRVSSVRGLIEDKGHTLLFLPPYSPFLNPIENMFSKWKEGVKRGNPSNEDELLRLINSSFLGITELNCKNYYTHMLGFVFRCLNHEMIEDG
jgi:transposase